MKQIFAVLTLFNIIFISGCSSSTHVADEFQLLAGKSIKIHVEIQSKFTDSGLYFTLRDIPITKKDRDFTDFIDLELLDEQGKSYRPEKIWDINGSKRDIVASFHELPKNTYIKTIKITALQDLDVTNLRWWTGKFK